MTVCEPCRQPAQTLGWRNVAAARRFVRTDLDQLRIGWLGCGRTLIPQSPAGPNYWEFDEDAFRAAIHENRPQVDLLIASIHIGYEYIEIPSPAHKALAERCVAAEHVWCSCTTPMFWRVSSDRQSRDCLLRAGQSAL